MRAGRAPVILCCWLGLCFFPAASGHGEEEWQMLAERWLNATFPEPNTRWSVWVLSAPSQDIPGQHCILGQADSGRPAKKSMRLLIGTPDSRRPAGELLVSAARLKKVMVANRLLGRGEALAPDAWHWEERPAGGLPADIVSQAGDLIGQRVKKVLTAREVITQHALEPIPDVLSGQRLRLQVCGAGVVVSIEAEALQEGRIGDSLRLQNPGTGKIFAARVVGAGRAEINLSEGGGAP